MTGYGAGLRRTAGKHYATKEAAQKAVEKLEKQGKRASLLGGGKEEKKLFKKPWSVIHS